MKTITVSIEKLDCEDHWAIVELYRWQYGHLPGDKGKPVLRLSVSEGLRGMAEAIKKNDPSNFPDPFNVMMVLKYAAKIIDAKC